MSVQAGMDMLAGGGDEGNNTSPVTESAVEAPAPVETQQDTQQSGHPAWDDVIKYVQPDQVETVRQQLRQWDSGVQRRFDEVHSRYKPFEPFLGHNPQTLEQALTLFNVFNGDPRTLYDQMGQHFGFSRGQGRDDSLDVGEFAEDDKQQQAPDITQHPQFQQLQAQQAQLQQMIFERQQQEEAAQADQWLESEIAKHSQANPGVQLDWEYIITKAQAIADKTGNVDSSIEHAVTDYLGLISKVRTIPSASASAPRLLPTVGGAPSNITDVSKLSDKDRRALGVEMLKNLSRET